MKKVQELIKAYLENEDKDAFAAILELLKTEEEMFVISVRVTNNFYLAAENGKPATFIFTSKQLADNYVRELKQEGLETKSMQIPPEKRIAFFSDLYRSGFEAVVIDQGETSLSMSLFSIIEKPENEEQFGNPSLMRAANQFYQALAVKQVVKPMQDWVSSELYKAKFLIPSESGKESSFPVISDNRNSKFYPIFTDLVEFGKFDKKQRFQATMVKFRDLKKLIRKVDGIVLNPLGFGLRLDMEKLEKIDSGNSTLKVVK